MIYRLAVALAFTASALSSNAEAQEAIATDHAADIFQAVVMELLPSPEAKGGAAHASGPLLLDLGTSARAFNRVSTQPIHAASLTVGFQRPYRTASRDTALACITLTSSRRSCAVSDDGLLIEVNRVSFVEATDEFEVIATLYYTQDRGGGATAIGGTELQFFFVLEGGRVALKRLGLAKVS